MDRLTESLDFTDYASRIIHPIVRTLDQSPELRPTAMDTLSSLVFQLGKKVRQEAETDMLLRLSVAGRRCERLHLLVYGFQTSVREQGTVGACFPLFICSANIY